MKRVTRKHCWCMCIGLAVFHGLFGAFASAAAFGAAAFVILAMDLPGGVK